GPIETPEGPNIGLIGSLATYARVNRFGFIETPYRKVENGRVTDKVEYLTATEEERYIIAQANAPLNEDGTFVNERALVRLAGGEVDTLPVDQIDYMDVSPKQIVSVSTALRSEEHTSELQSRENLVCRLLLETKKHKESNTSS